MAKAIGMIEYATVSAGISGADIMLKTAAVDVIEAQTVCPGKYIAIITGELSSVKASIEASKEQFADKLIDSFVLGNPHSSLIPAIYGANAVENPKALGIMETFSVASMIVAADVAAKTAEVDLIELRLARGMCGKSYMLITGEVAAVEAAMERAKAGCKDGGMFLDSRTIANPDKKLWESIL